MKTRTQLALLLAASIPLAACGTAETEPGYTLETGSYALSDVAIGSADGCALYASYAALGGIHIDVTDAVATIVLDSADVTSDPDARPQSNISGNRITPIALPDFVWPFELASGGYCFANLTRRISGELTGVNAAKLRLTHTYVNRTCEPLVFDPTCTSELLFTVTRTGP